METRFVNPPINELIIGAYFDPPLFSLRSQHIGLFWTEIRKNFPTIEQQLPIGSVGNFKAADAEETYPMPRYWFVSKDQTNLIQVQKNAFLFNWRRRETEYPHYKERLKPAFDRYYQVFEKFALSEVGVQVLKIGRRELTYINVIEQCDYWQGPQDTYNLIPSFRVPNKQNFPVTHVAFNCTYTYLISPDLQLQISVRNGKSTKGAGIPVLVFEIKATGQLNDVTKPYDDSWYDRAHDQIISWFLSMTNKNVQRKYWIRTGEIKK